MGSLGTGTAISNIKYNNIYTWQSNQMFMIKSNGGDGYIKDCTFTNFIGHSNAYALDVNGKSLIRSLAQGLRTFGQGYSRFTCLLSFNAYGFRDLIIDNYTEYWTQRTLDPGNGVVITGLTFSNWKGTIIDPKRAPINVVCADAAPCSGISLSNIAMWSDTNAAIHYYCESAYGSGYCVRGSGTTSYSSSTTVNTAPSGYNGAKMPDDLPSGLGLSVSIAIPTIPTSFYPGVTAISKLLNGVNQPANGLATTLATSTKAAATTATGN